MKVDGYLTINNKGSAKFTKNRCNMNWNEISMKLNMDIPDKLFERPLIEANIDIDESIIPKPQPIETIINTKELIEQSTGAKIDFRIITPENNNEGDD